jgi:uncharacterized protein YdhG (YjbR/CyaY superfamily)
MKTITKPAAKPKTVDDYLAGATREQRVALNKVRKSIKAAAPKAIEGISYGIVGFKYKGQRLIYYGYWKSHLAVYGAGAGNIKFTPAKPLTDREITRMVKDRVAAIDRERTG